MDVFKSDFRNYKSISDAGFDDEKFPTASSVEQRAVESSCLRLLAQQHNSVELRREKTLKFLHRCLKNLPTAYEYLDASQPWLVYWILHSLELLGTNAFEHRIEIGRFLLRCQNKDGGFGGGPGQLSHLAPTYAAVNALVILGERECMDCIDREALARWLNSLRQEDGSFVMHQGGEVDIRGVYCALSAAVLTNIYSEDLFRRTASWVLSCQTYEGGFGGVPGMEAHGGYSFCGLASLLLMNKGVLCDTNLLLKWAANRQMKLEGGFQGRTNKLVDGCYSFWQGGIFPLLHDILSTDPEVNLGENWLFDCDALQEYVLLCCQDSRGGLVDKPGKNRDNYHTCYALSGLSLAQHRPNREKTALGKSTNLLTETHPLFNVGVEVAEAALLYFKQKPVPNVASS